MLGIINIKKTFGYAEKVALDFEKISPNAEPPICKILNSGKFKYDSNKRIEEGKNKELLFLKR